MEYKVGDRVTFLSENDLEYYYELVVGYKYQEYRDAVMDCAEKTFVIDKVYDDGRITFEDDDTCIKTNRNGKWIFYPQFVTLANEEGKYDDSIPDLLGDSIYKGL